MGSEMCIRDRLFSMESSSAVRALDVRRPITGTFLEGEGGSLAFGDSDSFSVDFKFTLSACRGEVCIYVPSIFAISRINNFVFECCIVLSMTCERMHTHTQSDMSVMQHCMLSRLSNHRFIESVRIHSLCSLMRVCVCVYSVICHSSTHVCVSAFKHAHARDSNRFAAQVAE